MIEYFFYRVFAIDDDSGSNAEIDYSINNPTVVNVKSNADIYLNSVIDFENQTFHRSQVIFIHFWFELMLRFTPFSTFPILYYS